MGVKGNITRSSKSPETSLIAWYLLCLKWSFHVRCMFIIVSQRLCCPVIGWCCFDETSELYRALLWPGAMVTICVVSTILCFLSQNCWGSVFKQICLCYWDYVFLASESERFTWLEINRKAAWAGYAQTCTPDLYPHSVVMVADAFFLLECLFVRIHNV